VFNLIVYVKILKNCILSSKAKLNKLAESEKKFSKEIDSLNPGDSHSLLSENIFSSLSITHYQLTAKS